jgi:6-phosphogluconolactonase (cycloisomerase 2 family)
VFTTTNGANGNAVVAFSRLVDGTLSYVGTYATGGSGVGGTNDPLQSQFALALDGANRFLYVVNAGSNTVSSFAVQKKGLTLVSTMSSGGVFPVSVSAGARTLYVLNAGDNTVGVLRIGSNGSLTPLPAFTKALSAGAAGAAEVRLSPDGRVLTVTERQANRLEVFLVKGDGSLDGPVVTPSAGNVPFGFDYTPRGLAVVSEAGTGSASSYRSLASGALSVVSAAAPTLQRAPCWLIVDNAGRFAFTANAGSATITGFAILDDGRLRRIETSGVSADLGTGANPLDLDTSRDGKFLYVFKNGTGSIGGYAVANDGRLTFVSDTPGLAARGGYMGLAAY